MGQSVDMSTGSKQVGNFVFSKETPDDLIVVLLKSLKLGKRIRVFYGDRHTGIDWLEEFDTMGYLGVTRSHSGKQSLILRPRKDSTGGGILPTGAILKVTIDKVVVYQDSKYTLPQLRVVPLNMVDAQGRHYRAGVEVFKDGVWTRHGSFASTAQARNFVTYITGQKNVKS